MNEKPLQSDLEQFTRRVVEHLNLLKADMEELQSVIRGYVNQPVKEKAPEISLEKVRGVLAEKSREHIEEVRTIIQSYGVNRLSEIDPAYYPEVLEKAETL